MILSEKELLCELYILGLLCVLIVFKKIFSNRELYANKRLYAKLLLACSAFMLADIFWIISDDNRNAMVVNYIANMVYFVAVATVCFDWFVLAENFRGVDLSKKKGLRIVLHLPYMAAILLSVTTYQTHWLFYVDDTGTYTRGPLFGLQLVFMYGYVVYAVVRSLICAKNDYVNRRKYVDMALATFWPIMGSIVQVVANRPYFVVGIVLGVLNLYLNLQQQQISTDLLTGSNNKTKLVQFLADKIKTYDGGKQLVLLILDIEGLRYINDIFGYEKGDKAIMTVVEALRTIASRKGYFVCRYGGDELALVCESIEPIDMVLLTQSIQEEVNKKLAKEQFTVNLRFGHAGLERGMSVREFLYKAYENMRENKENTK